MTPSCFLQYYVILAIHPGCPWPLCTPTELPQGPLHPTCGTGELERNYMAVLEMSSLSLLGRENWEGSYLLCISVYKGYTISFWSEAEERVGKTYF